MARSLFGGSSDDYAVDSNGRPVAGRRVRFYTSAAMSTEITDLASDAAGTGSPLTVTTDSRGYWGPVYGPDAVTVMYAGTVDAAGNPPAYVVAVYTHTQTGGGGGAGVSSFNTRTGAVSLSKADVTGTGLAAADVAADASGAASTAQTAAQTYADTADVLRAKPRGAWVTAMAYAVNDVVTSGGAAYRCLVAHTSGASFSGAGTNWEAWGSAASVTLLDRGNWATATAYAVGDTVTQSGNRYICVSVHTSGTFATDLAAAKWDFTGVASAAGTQETVNTVATSGAAQTIPDVTTATMNRITLTANCTFTFPAAGAGKGFSILLTQDATGSRTATWPTVKWAAGVVPTLTTAATKSDELAFRCYDGTNWIGTVAGQNF